CERVGGVDDRYRDKEYTEKTHHDAKQRNQKFEDEENDNAADIPTGRLNAQLDRIDRAEVVFHRDRNGKEEQEPPHNREHDDHKSNDSDDDQQSASDPKFGP